MEKRCFKIYIRVWYESDQKLEGVVRISEVDVDDLGDSDKVENEIFNKLAEREYFTEVPNWSDEIKKDISNLIGCSSDVIEIC